ncbi:hypothetical protein I7I48_09063 [Histoplasma ohiense]|nr:hypothetical protein I7I48_09063 [Histoplasma ohiense (nom. inval.)]
MHSSNLKSVLASCPPFILSYHFSVLLSLSLSLSLSLLVDFCPSHAQCAPRIEANKSNIPPFCNNPWLVRSNQHTGGGRKTGTSFMFFRCKVLLSLAETSVSQELQGKH